MGDDFFDRRKAASRPSRAAALALTDNSDDGSEDDVDDSSVPAKAVLAISDSDSDSGSSNGATRQAVSRKRTSSSSPGQSSRSRRRLSLTPPPQFCPRKITPTKRSCNNNNTLARVFDDIQPVMVFDDNEEQLDPELAAIAHDPSLRSTLMPVTDSRPVTIHVKTIPNASQSLQPVALTFKMKPSDPFDLMMARFCEHVHVEVMFLYHFLPVLPSTTPAALGITADEPVSIVACTEETYQMLKVKKQEEIEKKLSYQEIKGESFDYIDEPLESGLTLQIRLKNRTEKLTVHPDASIELLLHQCIELFQLGSSSTVNLEFDGEVLDGKSTLSEHDLENDDLLDLIVR